jgi:triacylglycerol lipase
MPTSPIVNWIEDYLYFAKARLLFSLNPPQYYLDNAAAGKPSIILIPGVRAKWQFLKFIADSLAAQGYPIYVVEKLGYNRQAIDHSAKLVRELIDEKKLDNVIIVAHSKGGLIAKYLLAFANQDNRVKKVIAIATPWQGSEAVNFLPGKAYQELRPSSPMIAELNRQAAVNDKIVSIFGSFDNHVWPTESCRLDGAKNIQVDIYGHHKILFDKQVCEIVANEVKLAADIK